MMTIIEVGPYKWAGECFEAPGVEPVFLEKDLAIGYAETRACFSKGEIRILDANGKIERTIVFDETGRRLG